MEWAVVGLFWMFCAWLVFRRKTLLSLAAAIVFQPFGTWAVIPTVFTGGLTILPASVLAAIAIALFVASSAGRTFLLENAFSIRRLGLATVFLAVAIFSTLFYPRIFAGIVEVVPQSGDAGSYSSLAGGWTPLSPSPQNISQLGYLLLAILLLFCFAFVLRSGRYQQVVLKALAISGSITVLSGIIDYASYFVDLSFLLSPFRTANYAILEDVSIGGSKRVIGLMPEASAFGPMCVAQGLLVLLWCDAIEDERLRRYCRLLLAPSLFLFAFLSTSSSAYMGLGAAVVLLGCRIFLAMLRRRNAQDAGMRGRGRPVKMLGLAWLAACAVAYLLDPALFASIETLADRMIFQKSTTGSFEQRMEWNAVSLQALADTFGLGVGVGGTRSSSWPVAIVSSVGIPGALALFGLMLHLLFSRKTWRRPSDAILCSGGVWAILPLLVSNALTASTADPGIWIMLILGVCAAMGPARDTSSALWPDRSPATRGRAFSPQLNRATRGQAGLAR